MEPSGFPFAFNQPARRRLGFQGKPHLQKEKTHQLVCLFFLEVRLSLKAESPAGGLIEREREP